jgi:6-phosphogluconate dehydrogenase
MAQLIPLMSPGDVLIDGGNEHYTNTERRTKEVEAKGLLYVGTGVSGGEEGALKGPSMMPGGSEKAWPLVKPIFQAIAAKVGPKSDIPCCEWVGPRGAGHYVKMVHNGIEYGDIQLICEAYAILKDILEMQAPELADVFAEWNKGELDSYLIQITSEIFRKIDPDTGKPLVDMILDKAGQKGTGIWTLQSAIRQSVVISTINAAVEARVVSAQKEERVAASKILPQPRALKFKGNRPRFIDAVRDALYASNKRGEAISLYRAIAAKDDSRLVDRHGPRAEDLQKDRVLLGFAQGASVSFAGTGQDPEDGALTGGSLVWTSSIDGELCSIMYANRSTGYVGSSGTYAPPALSTPRIPTSSSTDRSRHTPTRMSGPTPCPRK